MRLPTRRDALAGFSAVAGLAAGLGACATHGAEGVGAEGTGAEGASPIVTPNALLRPPFDPDALRPLIGRAAAPFAPSPPPAPIVALDHKSMYREGTGSTEVDPKALAAYKAKLKPIQDYTRALTRIADSYATAKTPDPAIARNGLDWLGAWARAEALTQIESEQGDAVVSWETIPIAWSYFKLRAAAAPKEQAKIERWIAGLSAGVRAAYSSETDRNSRNNNHVYWAAWCVMSAGLIAQDQSAYDWAAAIYDKAMGQIESDGALPLEMARKARALHYHNFALAPLTMLAETLAANGRGDPYAQNGGALKRLANLTLDGLADPSGFEKRTGEKQVVAEALTSSQLAWMEPYRARTGDARTIPFLIAKRPMIAPRLGGDLSYYFGAAAAGILPSGG